MSPFVIGPTTQLHHVFNLSRWEEVLNLFNDCWDEDTQQPDVEAVHDLGPAEIADFYIALLRFKGNSWKNARLAQEMITKIRRILDRYWSDYQGRP